jgi:hypothetical protein
LVGAVSCTITTLDEDDSSVRRIWAVVVQDRNRYALLSSAQLDRGLQQEYLRKLGSSAVDELQARLASLDQASAAFLLGTSHGTVGHLSHHACAGKKVKEAHSNFKSGNATKIEKTIVKKMADGRAPAHPKPLPSAQSLLSLTPPVCANSHLRRQGHQGGVCQRQEPQSDGAREDDRQED